jgi:hypothetical protein
MATKKTKMKRIHTSIKGRSQCRNVQAHIENTVERIEQYPWDEWEHEYLTEKNDDGGWKYRSLKDFAEQKQVTYRHLKTVCSLRPRDGYPYRGDWDSMRNGLRWQSTAKRGANMIAKVDHATRLMEIGDVTLEECDRWIHFGNRLGEDAEAYFQGQSLAASTRYPDKLSKNPKLRKTQLQERAEDLERFATCMTIMERIQKFVMAWVNQRNKILNTMTKIQSNAVVPAEGNTTQLSAEDSLALKFFTGYKEFGENYGIEIPGLNEAPKTINADAKQELPPMEMVEVGKDSQ